MREYEYYGGSGVRWTEFGLVLVALATVIVIVAVTPIGGAIKDHYRETLDWLLGRESVMTTAQPATVEPGAPGGNLYLPPQTGESGPLPGAPSTGTGEQSQQAPDEGGVGSAAGRVVRSNPPVGTGSTTGGSSGEALVYNVKETTFDLAAVLASLVPVAARQGKDVILKTPAGVYTIRPDGTVVFPDGATYRPGEIPALNATAGGRVEPMPTPDPTGNISRSGLAEEVYQVRNGDTLYSIARRYDTTVEALMAVNHLRNKTIYTGQRLAIPGEIRQPVSLLQRVVPWYPTPAPQVYVEPNWAVAGASEQAEEMHARVVEQVTDPSRLLSQGWTDPRCGVVMSCGGPAELR